MCRRAEKALEARSWDSSIEVSPNTALLNERLASFAFIRGAITRCCHAPYKAVWFGRYPRSTSMMLLFTEVRLMHAIAHLLWLKFSRFQRAKK
jgi:hypothetical protein